MNDLAPSDQQGTTNILPVPPPLEFPFPAAGTDSSYPSSTVATTKASSPTTSPGANSLDVDKHSSELAKPALEPIKITSTPSNPTVERHHSERPVPSQKRSILGLKRRSTGPALTALNDAAWHPDLEDTDSSSSDDEAPLKKSETVQHSQHKAQSARRKGNVLGHDIDGPTSKKFSRFSVGNENFRTKGKVSKTSGRLDISVNETAKGGYLAKALGTTLQHHLQSIRKQTDDKEEEGGRSSRPGSKQVQARPVLETRVSAVTGIPLPTKTTPKPKLNIVIMVIGSRGDIQPFLKIGKLLKEEHGHRVRIATHPAFKEFVEHDSGLEFFSVGGDPAELMAFMVKNPGLIPSLSTVRAGEIGKKRESMFEMFQGFWRACINATDDEANVSNLRMMENKNPFVADAIIANPPSFAHVHCAERLGIPLHLMFTFPYSPTQQFPHPLANIQRSNVDANYTNFMSYPLVEMMTWQGLGDLVNEFRIKTLGLEPVSTVWAPGQLFRMKVPYTYMWSPGLIPKPMDWGPEIDIAGFVFLDLASSFKPPETLSNFLEDGEPPVYIGFGSIVVDDPDKFTAMIFKAVELAGVRALVSKGWGGLGDKDYTPNNIYMLENTPHDWLFPRVSAVVHHGGAGTTAIGLKCGKPTMIVPFFGDQPFWGAMVAKAGAGAQDTIPYKQLTANKLAEGIKQCLSFTAQQHAQKLADHIASEGDGARNAVQSFHQHLPLQGNNSMRCSIIPDEVAVWELKRARLLQFSALAAELLVQKKKIRYNDLRLVRHKEWNDLVGPGEPLTGGGLALLNSVGDMVKGVGGTPVRWFKTFKKREEKAQIRSSSMAVRQSEEREESIESRKSSQKSDAIEKAKMSRGGEHGAEKFLADQPLEARGHDKFQEGDESYDNLSSHQKRDGNDDDVSSDLTRRLNDNIAQDIALDIREGLCKTGGAIARVPMDLSLAIAQGFHNAPRLYGDSTVRTSHRISGIHSGLRAAGEEFVFGIYDGVSGLWLQPYHGARDDGATGFILGVGKGLGGFVLKDLAAIFGPFGYTLKGVHKELIKGRQPTAYIRKARIQQGGMDVRALDQMGKQRREAMVERAWAVVENVCIETENAMKGSMKEKIQFKKERRKLIREGKFESVGNAAVALEKWRDRKRMMRKT
ncbi:MAG: hypothetical protein LQ351_005734 [Letrouitia transgressa]|nr:MAG: hypothetical protein LQ351_005734 [Letrouitia transgressa]